MLEYISFVDGGGGCRSYIALILELARRTTY